MNKDTLFVVLLFGIIVVSLFSGSATAKLKSESEVSLSDTSPLLKRGRTIERLSLLAGETIRISVASDGTQGDDISGLQPIVAISANGRYVAFDSIATNLVPDDTIRPCGAWSPNSCPDVFVHDRGTGETTRVSVASDGTEGNGASFIPSISPDGQLISFESIASNLVDDDTNETGDIFVHNRVTMQTERVSVASDGSEANNSSVNSFVSPNGQYVVFSSLASNLVADDTNSLSDIFLHNRATGETTRVSVASDGTEANGNSYRAVVTAGGRFVMFVSYATNLVDDYITYPCENAPSNLPCANVYVRDLLTDETSLVSVSSTGEQGNDHSWRATITPDGRYVAFSSYASNLTADDTNGKQDAFIHDRVTGETTRVSVASSGEQGNEDSFAPSISADAQFVSFSSLASNLVDNDTNGQTDIFIHDRETRVTERVSVAYDGSEGNDGSYNISPTYISADGGAVAFISRADNLVEEDSNAKRDVFIHELGPLEVFLPLIVR